MRHYSLSIRITETVEGEDFAFPLVESGTKVHLTADGTILDVKTTDNECDKCGTLHSRVIEYLLNIQALNLR